MKRKYVVMLGTSMQTMGGISAVINQYRAAGLFLRYAVIYLPTHRDGSKLMKLAICLSSLLRYVLLLLRRKVALVHVHVSSNASFWRKTIFLLTTFLFKVPSILHLHGGGFSEFYDLHCNRMKKRVIRYVFDRSDMVVVLSESWRHWVAGITQYVRIRTIFNPVLLPPEIEADLRDPASILFLGQLSLAKGAYDLLNAVAELIIRHPNLQLFLAGHGDLRMIENEAIRLGIDAHVHVLGWVTGTYKSTLLQQATILALPSYAEGMPMSILEGMAIGLPVITTRVGGVPEVVSDGIDGYLIEPGDRKSLTTSLEKLLIDKDLRKRMGAAARDKVERKFAAHRILPRIEQLYRDVGGI